MSIKILKSNSVSYSDNSAAVAYFENKLEKIKLELKKILQQKTKISEEITLLESNKDSFFAEKKKLGDEIVLEKEKEAKKLVEDAQVKAQEIILESENKVAELKSNIEKERLEVVKEAETNRDAVYEESKKNGHREGFNEGFDLGKKERVRISGLLKNILEETSLKRKEIISHFEFHLMEIAILMTKKVIKKITASQKDIVISNLYHSLKQMKGNIKIRIHINGDDLEVINSRKKEILANFEDLKEISFIEDPLIERGGCLVESDYSVIDARISSQLSKIENLVRSENLIKSL